MIYQSIYLLVSFWIFNSMFSFSIETQSFLIYLIDFVNVMNAYLNIRNYTIANFGKFDRIKYLVLCIAFMGTSIIYRRIILQGDLDPVNWTIFLKNHVIIVIFNMLIRQITPMQQKLIFTIAAFSSSISYYNLLKDIKNIPSLKILIPLVLNLNVNAYFSKFTLWLVDFILYGKVYPSDYFWHFLLNMSLVICAIFNNNEYGNMDNKKDFLWHYLVIYFLFINNHGYLFFKKRYQIILKRTASIQMDKEEVNQKSLKNKQNKNEKIKSK